MRPSRSHESLSSPLKGSIRINQVSSSRNNSIYQQHLTVQSTNNSIKTKFSQNKPYRLSQPTIAEFKNKLKETESSNNLDQAQTQIVDSIIKISFNSESGLNAMLTNVSSIHNSLLNEENCFELKCYSSTITVVNASASSEEDVGSEINNEQQQNGSFLKYYASSSQYTPLFFMCRSNEEREKWIQCLRGVIEPNFLNKRRDENSLQLWILEAKGQAISSKPNKRYFCQIHLNNDLYARTCCKLKKEILFWGENFDFK